MFHPMRNSARHGRAQAAQESVKKSPKGAGNHPGPLVPFHTAWDAGMSGDSFTRSKTVPIREDMR
jgi:hypothetical protein